MPPESSLVEEATEYDVVVSGSGPAGSTAAFVAANRGLKTLFIEKTGPPRDKTCGGLLTDLCVEFVRRIIGFEVPDEVQIPPSPMPVFVVPPSGVAQGFVVPKEKVLNVTRRAFDGWLAALAVKRGAELQRDTEILGFRLDTDGIEVTLKSQRAVRKVRTRSLIGADGFYSPVRSQLNPRPLEKRAYYIQEYYPRNGSIRDWFYLMYRGDTSPIYAYVIPKWDKLCLGIGIHKSVPPTFEAGMARFKEWLTDEFGFRDDGVTKREGFSVPFGAVTFGEGSVLLAGDAAGLCYPPTGEGITFAIQSGAAAAEAVASGREGAAEEYATKMVRVAKWVEDAAARTLSMTDEEREDRIVNKAGL